MDDQTRGDDAGATPASDVPLKRDRKLLRSSQPVAPRSSQARPTGAGRRVAEPEATQASESTGGSSSLEPGSENLPFSEGANAQSGALSPAEELFSGQWTASLPAPAMPASTIPPVHVPTPPPDATTPYASYLPPAGISGPGHPKLGPLVPRRQPQFPGLTALDVSALVGAILLPPIGLALAIVAIIRGNKVRGWASDLARAAIGVSLIMAVVFAAVGGVFWLDRTEKAEELAQLRAEQRSHARIDATSAEFCRVLAENPSIFTTADADYGWPQLDTPEGYPAAIAHYADVWGELASVAPAGISADANAASSRISGIVEIAEALGKSNRAGDVLGLHEQTDVATVESWYVEYCDSPE